MHFSWEYLHWVSSLKSGSKPSLKNSPLLSSVRSFCLCNMPFEEEFAFEIPAYTPPRYEVAYMRPKKRSCSRRERYSPYALARSSLHQMTLSYVDASYVEERVEVIRPIAPVGAMIRPPPPGLVGFFGNIGRGLLNALVGLIAKCLEVFWTMSYSQYVQHWKHSVFHILIFFKLQFTEETRTVFYILSSINVYY